MAKFNIGDVVIVDNVLSLLDGETGEIVGMDSCYYHVIVFKTNGKEVFKESELKLAPTKYSGRKTISLDDVSIQPKRFMAVLAEMVELYNKKNHDYGDSFANLFKDFGLVYSVPRIYEKATRLKTLLKAKNEVNESVRDTLIDICVYAALTIVELDKNTNGNGKDLQKSDHR